MRKTNLLVLLPLLLLGLFILLNMLNSTNKILSKGNPNSMSFEVLVPISIVFGIVFVIVLISKLIKNKRRKNEDFKK